MLPIGNAASFLEAQTSPLMGEREKRFATATARNCRESPQTNSDSSHDTDVNLLALLKKVGFTLTLQEIKEAFPPEQESRNLAIRKIEEAVNKGDLKEAWLRIDVCSIQGNLLQTLAAIRSARSETAASASNSIQAPPTGSDKFCYPKDKLQELLAQICSDMTERETWEAFPYDEGSRNLAATKIKEAIDNGDFEEAMLRLDTSSRDGDLQNTLTAIRTATNKDADNKNSQNSDGTL
ncbi:MAG: hypothetical protein ACRC24_03605 [Vibrionaceae bacterium]